MKRFLRAAEPDGWSEWDRRWCAKLTWHCEEHASEGNGADLNTAFQWQREGKDARRTFHETVREEGSALRLCAYCDGSLDQQSPASIDHFLPSHAFPELGMRWENLFPSCVVCNSTMKGAQWSCHLVRPDEPIESWFVFDPADGSLRPAPHLDRRTFARVRLTLRVFGLNSTARCNARKTRFRELQNARGTDHDYLQLRAREGDYRFIADLFLRL